MLKKSFIEKEKEYSNLWFADPPNKKEALKIVEQCVKDYPENLNIITEDLASLYSQLDQHDQAIQILNKELDRGIWYPKYLFRSVWNLKEYEHTVTRWNEVSAAAKENSKAEWEIILPPEYNPNKTYPLFIALHTSGHNIARFKESWTTLDKINREYIIVYIQSSQMVGSFHYSWEDYELAHKDIHEMTKEVFANYSVNHEQMIVGGFSESGTLSMDIALNHTYLPVKGFIALSPYKKLNLHTKENILKAKQQGIKGSIITGDQDKFYDEQKEMLAEFDEIGFNCYFSVKDNFGHWFPEDLEERIDISMKYIVEK
ncbi:hypothetical protein [Chengkuizengella sediminis]|uniref:hypothetical protein n=1 Tax=Chengkuizengella sediminis TaxID=1885917 RepID=UPI00138A31FD|nr:hypothetical protein [Chengkuizengella sediminis]NDI33974.1 hypothetical protein [Chengkuizengella sediminis]